MMQFKSVNDVLDYAIEKEEESAQFYTDLASKVKKTWLHDLLVEFAGEEMKHKAKLLSIKEGKLLEPSVKQVLDLKIGDYLVDVDAGEADLDYQQALILAMKREKASFRLYTDLADATEDPNLRRSFQALAQEEAKHKLRFEIEYDQQILTEN